MKTILIGDIHGCYKELRQLLDKVGFDSNEDKLILLGDLFDRGPDSYEVFQFVKELKVAMKERFIILFGSHESLLVNHNGLKKNLLWPIVGKNATILSFKKNHQDIQEVIAWIQENTVLYYEDALFQCVHAGSKYEDLSKNDEYTLTMDHHITKRNEYDGKLLITGHIHLKQATWFKGDKKTKQLLPYNRQLELPKNGIICLDTGCGEGNYLTGMVIKDDMYFLKKV